MIKRFLVWLRGLADFFRGKRKIGFRQGDVMFFPIGDFPKDVELKPAGSVLRIQGEGSGHFHELKGVDVLTPVKPQIDWGWLVDIILKGRQGLVAGDIRIKGWLIEVDGQHIIIKVPQKNIGGWIVKKNKNGLTNRFSFLKVDIFFGYGRI